MIRRSSGWCGDARWETVPLPCVGNCVSGTESSGFPSQPNTSLCLGSLCPTPQTPAVSLPRCHRWYLTCALPGMAAVSIRKRCTDTAPRTKDQGHLHLWLHLKDGFNKKGKMTQNHNFSITRDAGFSQFFLKSYFRSLRSLLVRQLEQQHGRPTWATSLDRSSCVSLRQQRVTAYFPCAPD